MGLETPETRWRLLEFGLIFGRIPPFSAQAAMFHGRILHKTAPGALRPSYRGG